jgi:hypothetical protein
LRTSATAFNVLSRHNVHFLERNPSNFCCSLRCVGRYHHEEDVIGPRCGRDFGRFRSLARLCWSAHLSRTRRLSVLVGLCRCPGWRADLPLLLAYPALLGRFCLARAPRAHLRLIRSWLFRCLDRRTRRCDVGDESHGGRLWTTACQPRGALFQFAIPARSS